MRRDGIQRDNSPLASSNLFTISCTPEWNVINAEFMAILSPVYSRLATDEISTCKAADIFSSLFKAHLERFDATTTTLPHFNIIHRTRRIERTVSRLRQLKNSTRKTMRQSSSEFHSINRAYSKALRDLNRNVSFKNLQKHEKAFRADHWTYSKNLCSSGTSALSLICSSDEAFAYFSNTAKESSSY